MKPNTLTGLLLAGAMAGLMGTAASAQMADFTQLQDSVKVGLESLQVNTDTLGQLSMAQVAQLNAILESGDTNEIKAQAAANVIAQASAPEPLVTATPEGAALLDALKTDLDRVGVQYAGLEGLTQAEAQQLTQVFERHPDDDVAAKQAAEAIILALGDRGDMPAADEGVIQLETQVSAKLTALGLTPPPEGSLTFEQVGKLAGIFDAGGTEAEQKASAMVVLGIN
jgi:hypothetical protein